jgi:hypothetical protein
MKIIPIALVIMVVPAATACSCKMLDPKDSLRRYDAVFTAQVVGVHYLDDSNGESPRIDVALQVLQYWKGPSGKTVEMKTIRRDRSCEGLATWEIRIGETLLIYATKVPTQEKRKVPLFTTDICSRTRILPEAVYDLQSLGIGRTPH